LYTNFVPREFVPCTKSVGVFIGESTSPNSRAPSRIPLILPLDLPCPIVMYLKGTILLYESYLRILLVCFVGTARSSGLVRVDGRTVIVLPLPVAWSLALDMLLIVHGAVFSLLVLVHNIQYQCFVP
jgi:hypothetical protein